ncbi:hypothetical protein CR513_07528, partial [Mucuna pruriens]
MNVFLEEVAEMQIEKYVEMDEGFKPTFLFFMEIHIQFDGINYLLNKVGYSPISIVESKGVEAFRILCRMEIIMRYLSWIHVFAQLPFKLLYE